MNGAVWFGLMSALVWGAGDFCGGLATRRARPLSVVLIAEISGAVLLLLAALAWRQPLPDLPTLGWSAGAGLAGAMGLVALYTALGRGHMGVVAPVSAVIAALVPIVASAYTGRTPCAHAVHGLRRRAGRSVAALQRRRTLPENVPDPQANCVLHSWRALALASISC